jgi:predicted small lipoprotein YifL
MRHAHTARLLLLILTSLTLLGGCGQTGPLYLPDEQQEEERDSP